MKNLLIKLSLIAIMVVACNTASAVFTDSPNTYALWHCDATNWAGAEETTPDDNSSGRTAHNLIINHQGEAVMMPGSPYGGSYLELDGTDHCTAWATLDPIPTEYLNLDVSFRATAFPGSGAFSALLWTYPLRAYLFDGAHVRIHLYDSALGAHVLTSTKTINLATWYSVNAVFASSTLQIIVGNDSEGYVTNSLGIGDNTLADPGGNNFVLAGWDAFAAGTELNGDLDEMRVNNIPEPFTFGLIGLLGLFLIRRK